METLQQLNTFRAEDFKSWLDQRLRQQYDNDPEVRYRACNFGELGIYYGDCESSMDSFERLFKKLSTPVQEAFQEGIFLLITQAQVDDFPKKAMQDLLFLAFRVKATKALNVLGPIIIDSAWGKKHRSLIYDSISIMMSLDRPTKELCKKHGFR